jgi:hypothetical protein
VHNRFGDADIKFTSTLELAEVVRRMANIGASYPDIVSILETAERQKNLPGQLLVDAVPTANRMYLEAILGKDVTSKDDDAVKRASASKQRPSRRWLLGLFARDTGTHGENQPATGPSKELTNRPVRGAQPRDDAAERTDRNAPTELDATDDAKKGALPDGSQAPPKDDSVQKAEVEETTHARRRLFDFFRGGDDS